MPFVGKLKSTGDRIDLTQIENPRQQIRKSDIICPYCESEMYLRSRLNTRFHFVHKSVCNSAYAEYAKPESALHLSCKRLIAQYLRREYASTGQIEIEHCIPEIRRIADVAMLFDSGYRLAHEIQLSAITPATLQERTNDYLLADYDVVWWLGRHALTEENAHWSLDTFGAVYEIVAEPKGTRETLVYGET